MITDSLSSLMMVRGRRVSISMRIYIDGADGSGIDTYCSQYSVR